MENMIYEEISKGNAHTYDKKSEHQMQGKRKVEPTLHLFWIALSDGISKKSLAAPSCNSANKSNKNDEATNNSVQSKILFP